MVIKFFKPSVKTGWRKTDRASLRRYRVLKAHKGDLLASGRSMQSLANVTQDSATRRLASSDAKYFFRLHERSK